MMAVDITARIVFLVFLIGIPIGAIFLQIYLSKRESKWFGFILPMVTFAISLLAVLGMAVYTQMGHFVHTEYSYIDGELVTSIITEEWSREVIPGAIGGAVVTFFLMNIPTAILLLIYKVSRSSRNRKRDLEKMSIQDL